MKAWPLSARRWTAVLFLALVGLVATSVGAEPGTTSHHTVTAVVLESSAPLQFRDSSGQARGFAVDIMDEVAHRQSLEVRYVFAKTWAEMIATVERGDADVVASLAVSERRSESLLFSQPIHTTSLSAFVRSNEADVKSLGDARRVGLPTGSVAEAGIPASAAKIRYATIAEGLFALLAGEVGAFVVADELMLKAARDTGVEDRIKTVGKPLADVRRAMAVRKDHVALLGQLNRGLDGFVGSERYQEIYVHWYGAPKPFWSAKHVTLVMFTLLAVIVVFMLFWRYHTTTQLAGELIASIHERERAEQRLTGILQSIPIVMWAVDDDGVFTLCEGQAATTMGVNPKDFLGKTLAERENVLPQITRNLRRALEGTELSATMEVGEAVFDTWCMPLREGGDISGAFAVAWDVTARRKLAEELQRSHKLESVGILAGGIAHDFNNILSAVLGNIDISLRHLPIDAKARTFLTEAESATKRASELTRQLLTFARGGSPVRTALSVEEVIREASSFSVRGSSARCVYEVDEALWPVHADRGQIAQVVQNLVINATQAMPDGGTIRITAENAELGAESTLPLSAGRYVRISVSDQGAGIAAENLDRIFDPYFTTKPTGQGLGLAITYSIVKKHEGHLLVESEPDRGTTFTLYLPATDAVTQEPERPSSVLPTHTGRILFMDDEEMLRRVAKILLEDMGYDVACAKDGEEAVKLYREAMNGSTPFDVVITDLTVPGGMGGRATLAALRELNPNARVIVSSGYSEDPVMASFDAEGFDAMIAKPYTQTDIERVLTEVQAKDESDALRSVPGQ